MIVRTLISKSIDREGWSGGANIPPKEYFIITTWLRDDLSQKGSARKEIDLKSRQDKLYSFFN